ncbi:hypothetical protein [Spongiimicrobium salis]|uniref:hypothetical protein n=1 Tax=Spongiimicrobium salis TaxID=1667022 RepID=UPI00374D5A2A
MKKLTSLKGAKVLKKEEQKVILGGMLRKLTCQQLFVSADCCDPRWTAVCGFPPLPCVNGVCIF